MIDLVSRYALQWRGDLVMAIESMTQGTLPPDGILSREMIAFYISIFIISMMALKSGRSLLYKIFDTCVALVLLGVTGAIVLGIPFGTFDDDDDDGHCRCNVQWVCLQCSHYIFVF